MCCVSFGDGMRAQGFDAGGGQYIAGADTHSDNMWGQQMGLFVGRSFLKE